jgi:hypothetical protein
VIPIIQNDYLILHTQCDKHLLHLTIEHCNTITQQPDDQPPATLMTTAATPAPTPLPCCPGHHGVTCHLSQYTNTTTSEVAPEGLIPLITPNILVYSSQPLIPSYYIMINTSWPATSAVIKSMLLLDGDTPHADEAVAEEITARSGINDRNGASVGQYSL